MNSVHSTAGNNFEYMYYDYMNMNINLINHINNSANDYVQLNSYGCWIVRLAKPALKTIQ